MRNAEGKWSEEGEENPGDTVAQSKRKRFSESKTSTP